MKIGDLVWCVYHIYFLPKRGIIIEIIEDMDTFYIVLIDDEVHTLSIDEVFIKESMSLEYQLNKLRISMKR